MYYHNNIIALTLTIIISVVEKLSVDTTDKSCCICISCVVYLLFMFIYYLRLFIIYVYLCLLIIMFIYYLCLFIYYFMSIYRDTCISNSTTGFLSPFQGSRRRLYTCDEELYCGWKDVRLCNQ